MIRVAFVLAYLATMALAVFAVDAGSDLEGWAVLIWAIASVALGLGTGWFGFAFLSFLAIPLAVPFGYSNDAPLHDPLPLWFGAIFLSLYSAGLILLAALANRTIRFYRERRKAPPERGFS